MSMETEREKRNAEIAKALKLVEGLRKGLCPCGYMGTISPEGNCFKCGTDWGIGPVAAGRDVGEADARIALVNETCGEMCKVFDALGFRMHPVDDSDPLGGGLPERVRWAKAEIERLREVGEEGSGGLATCLGCGKVGVVLKAYRAPGPDAEADEECAECGSGDVYDTVEEAFAALYANWRKRDGSASAEPQRAASGQIREAVDALLAGEQKAFMSLHEKVDRTYSKGRSQGYRDVLALLGEAPPKASEAEPPHLAILHHFLGRIREMSAGHPSMATLLDGAEAALRGLAPTPGATVQPQADPTCRNCGKAYSAHWSGQRLCPGGKGETAFNDAPQAKAKGGAE
jgi:hypothetical protein